MDGMLRVFVSEAEAEPERVAELTGYLREHLRSLDVADVSAIPSSDVPAGARAVESLALGGLVVSLAKSPESIRALMSQIVRWLNRAPVPGRSVRIEMDGDVLVLSNASAGQEAKLIDLFVTRHL